ncbi:MAG: biotin transporter BioY [Candidatus Omnitrophica bacterium]|nr:biotin transporter BioY [Candidatus Omnitrophota bacterium]
MYSINYILNYELINSKGLTRSILVTAFVMATAFGAYLRIPIPPNPVPITLQTFFVVLSGAVLGRKMGSLAQVSYLMSGALGMPIFQGYSAGISHLAGPTGGYLVGFATASFITGILMDTRRGTRNFLYILLAMSAGLLAIYICGISWLIIGYKFSFTKAVFMGLIPFIPGMLVKLLLASWVYLKIGSRTDSLIKNGQ